MKIAIIGTGNIGATLAIGWKKAGHDILLGVRNPKNYKGKNILENEDFKILPPKNAVEEAEVVLLAIPPENMESAADYLKNATDKTIIDPSNSVFSKPENYANGYEALTQLTDCKHIVKAFSNTGFQNMANPKGLDTFVAGESKKAKEIAKRLALDLGFKNCYDFGGKEQVSLLEQLAMCWINLAYQQGLGMNIALNVLQR